jgi:hypothetical protein
MKKWLIFLSGTVTGIVLTILLAVVVNSLREGKEENVDSSELVEKPTLKDDIKLFDEPGDIIKENSLKVFQVLTDHTALVRNINSYIGTVYLITNKDNKYYYDTQEIDIPKNKVIRQIGIYRYPTQNDIIKTVPIIMIMDK